MLLYAVFFFLDSSILHHVKLETDKARMCQSSALDGMWLNALTSFVSSPPVQQCASGAAPPHAAPPPAAVVQPRGLLPSACLAQLLSWCRYVLRHHIPQATTKQALRGFRHTPKLTVCQSWNRNVPGGAHGLLPCLSWRRGPDHASSQLAVRKTHSNTHTSWSLMFVFVSKLFF